jgi:hypothetical protein
MFLTGVVLGCYVGWDWLRTGQLRAMLMEDIVVARLPDRAQEWIRHPLSWYGLHQYVMWVLRIPLFASAAFTGFLILLATATRSIRRT